MAQSSQNQEKNCQREKIGLRIGLARASNIGSYFKINTPKESSRFGLFDGITGYDWCRKSENLFVAK
jgi:hypothetical protein